MLINSFFLFCRFVKELVLQRLEFQFCEYLIEFLFVRLFNLQTVESKVLQRHVGLDGCEEVTHLDVVDSTFHFLAHLPFELVGVLQEVIDTSELVDEFYGGLLTDTGASGEVVGAVSHQGEQVNDLCRGGDAVLLFYFLLTDDVVSATMTGTVHIYIRLYELTVVLVRCEHKSVDSIGSGLCRHCADDIISLIAVDLQHRYPVSFEDIFYDWHGEFDVLRCSLTLRLVLWERFMAEGLAMVEGHTDIIGMLLCQYLMEGIAESHNSRCVKPFRVYPG